MRNIKKLFFSLMIAILFCACSNSSAQPKIKKTVNVLTWWAYLDDPSTSKLIEKKCGAVLSADDYSSNDDMLRRYHANPKKYDILVFPDIIYNSIKNQIILNKSNLWKKSKSYNPIIQKRYRDSHFPHNVAYFSHSLTGFLWNEDVIQITQDDTVQSIFKKAKNNKVILLDDPREANVLLTAANGHIFNNTNDEISLINFKKLTQKTHIFISNETNQIYDQKDFAFSFQWSGQVFTKNFTKKHYNFLINKHLTYVASDLIAQINESKTAACAANILAGEEFLTALQNKIHYFTPYGNINNISNETFKELYKHFLAHLPNLQWLEPPSSAQLKKLNQEWEKIKFELAQERE